VTDIEPTLFQHADEDGDRLRFHRFKDTMIVTAEDADSMSDHVQVRLQRPDVQRLYDALGAFLDAAPARGTDAALDRLMSAVIRAEGRTTNMYESATVHLIKAIVRDA
jgi:hypothetical protein